MKRILVWTALSAVLLACGLDVGPLGAPKILLTPVLDTVFFGDQLVKRQVTYIDAHGAVQDPGPVAWSTKDTSVISVDPSTGMVKVSPGMASMVSTSMVTLRRGETTITAKPSAP